MADTLRDGLKTLVEFWRARAEGANLDLADHHEDSVEKIVADHYEDRANEIEALLEQTAPVEPPIMSTEEKLADAKARMREGLLAMGFIVEGQRVFSDDPFPASTEEPTVDSAGWIELKDEPGLCLTAEYSALSGTYYHELGECKHRDVARHWTIPLPFGDRHFEYLVPPEGATHDQV